MPEPQAPSPGEEIGEVVGYFAIPSAAIVRINKGSLKIGDTIWITGHTTDLKETIHSMQIGHDPITQAQMGQEIGIKVSGKVRRSDRVYKIS